MLSKFLELFLAGGFEGRAEHHSFSLLKVKEWLHYFLQLGLSDQIDLATVEEGRSKAI